MTEVVEDNTCVQKGNCRGLNRPEIESPAARATVLPDKVPYQEIFSEEVAVVVQAE